MANRSLILAALAGTLCLCCRFPEPRPAPDPIPPAPPEPATDGGSDADPREPEPEVGTACERACGRLQRLHCPEGEPTPGGQPCTKWLCEAASAGIVNMNLGCLEKITDCEQVNSVCRDGA